MMNISKILDPESGELKTNGFHVSATIHDAELDPFKCTFCGDAVTIECQDEKYIVLDNENLNELKRLIKKAEKYLNSLDYDEDKLNCTTSN